MQMDKSLIDGRGATCNSRTGWKWMAREEDLLLEICIGSVEDCSILALANKMKRSPLEVSRYVLDSEIPEMLGFEAFVGSEEEAEFLGLALSGVPLHAALRWCTADPSRPTAAELRAMMAGPDMRPAFDMARLSGVWITRMADLDSLSNLASRPLEDVQRGVQDVLARFDVPTPPVVERQLAGDFEGAETQPYSWAPAPLLKQISRPSKPGQKKSSARSKKFSSDRARRRYWAKRSSKRKSFN